MAKRTDIITALIAQLGTIPALTGKVHTGRRRPLQKGNLPAAIVYAESEEKELNAIDTPRQFFRTLEITIELFLEENTANYAALDTLGEAIETAILTDETLGGNVQSCHPLDDAYDLNEEGERPLLQATHTLQAEYVR